LPDSTDKEPVLVKKHLIPPVASDHIPTEAVRTLRALSRIPGEQGSFYVLLGPKGYEKERIVLARWNSNTSEMTNAKLLPIGFVGEGVTSISDGKVLVVDDLAEMVLVATEH
jgi:hypothetical protein